MGQTTSTNQLFNMIPEGCPVAVMIRRGGRENSDGSFLHALGAACGDRLKFVASSAYEDCLIQGKAIISAADQPLFVVPSGDLGNPSILINSEYLQAAESSWNDLGHDKITAKLMKGEQIPGFNDPSVSAQRLLCWMLEKSASAGTGISLFISHDIVMLVIMARLFSIQLTRDLWPNQFEGAVLWREGGRVICRYRETTSMASLVCQES